MKFNILQNRWTDALVATLFIFAVIKGLSSLLGYFDAIDVVGEALEDVEFTDVVYSTLRDAPPADENIVLVNVSELPRRAIAQQIEIINQYNPKVIGLDTTFPYPKDEQNDTTLAQALLKVDNLVMASKLLLPNSKTGTFDSIKLSAPMFRPNADFAFANLMTAEGVEQEDVKTCRSFNPTLPFKDTTQMSFAVRIAHYYAPKKVQKLINRDNEIEIINYKGNSLGSQSNFATTFYALDWYDVLDENFVPEMIEDKIVIFGFLGEQLGDRYSIEDKYYTPLNQNYAGRGEPDMYGAVIHANIISMILDEDYVYQISETTQVLIALIICYINAYMFSWIFYALKNWYDGITKLVQLTELLLLVGIIMYSYHYFNWNLELTLTMGTIALVGDSLEVYHGVFKNMFSKKGRKELFSVTKGKQSE